MTYVLMVWTVVSCQAYSCYSDWRQVLTFDYRTFDANSSSKILCEEAGKAMFADRKYQCIKTK
jgi:hypothetical protein